MSAVLKCLACYLLFLLSNVGRYQFNLENGIDFSSRLDVDYLRSVRYLPLRQNSLLNKISICKLLICSGNDLYKDVSERANNVFSLPINNYHKFVVSSRFNFGRTHVALKRVVFKLVSTSIYCFEIEYIMCKEGLENLKLTKCTEGNSEQPTPQSCGNGCQNSEMDSK